MLKTKHHNNRAARGWRLINACAANIIRAVYNISFDCPQTFAYTLTGLMQELEGRGGAVCRGVTPVDCLHGGGYLVDCLESLVVWPVLERRRQPCGQYFIRQNH